MKNLKFLILILTVIFTLIVSSSPALAELYQDNTDITLQTFTTVTTTSTKLVSKNWKRNYLLIQNLGATNIIVKFNSAHSASEGVVIFPNGNYEPYKMPVGDIYFKSASGTPDVSIIEGSQP